jgi:hypothetical protein
MWLLSEVCNNRVRQWWQWSQPSAATKKQCGIATPINRSRQVSAHQTCRLAGTPSLPTRRLEVRRSARSHRRRDDGLAEAQQHPLLAVVRRRIILGFAAELCVAPAGGLRCGCWAALQPVQLLLVQVLPAEVEVGRHLLQVGESAKGRQILSSWA